MPNTTTDYDSVLYPGGVYVQTQPDRLTVLGILCGVEAPAIERCRVLEIGCGRTYKSHCDGVRTPGSKFVGIDLASKLIESAQSRIKRADLTNIGCQRLT